MKPLSIVLLIFLFIAISTLLFYFPFYITILKIKFSPGEFSQIFFNTLIPLISVLIALFVVFYQRDIQKEKDKEIVQEENRKKEIEDNEKRKLACLILLEEFEKNEIKIEEIL
ncbi:MAG: hypothetical protein HWN67_03680 [Candidatus Helarchaeota archaeon]|nr:hypothetical protein [Candidatus Helarchaeota archaeon]